jgi:hypothetical protein
MNIQQFTQQVKDNWDHKRRNRPASEVLLQGPMPEINWPATYKQAGYISYQLKTLKTWTSMHEWCQTNIGQEHYSWTGTIFWFERQEDAVVFALRWS